MTQTLTEKTGYELYIIKNSSSNKEVLLEREIITEASTALLHEHLMSL